MRWMCLTETTMTRSGHEGNERGAGRARGVRRITSATRLSLLELQKVVVIQIHFLALVQDNTDSTTKHVVAAW